MKYQRNACEALFSSSRKIGVESTPLKAGQKFTKDLYDIDEFKCWLMFLEDINEV